jgi:uncharacterized protein
LAHFIDLRNWPDRTLEVDQAYDLAPAFATYPDMEKLEPVQARFQVSRSGGETFRVQGEWRGAAEVLCGRCREPFRLPLSTPFALTFFPESSLPRPAPGESELVAETVDVCSYREQRIEVLPMLEEQVHLALPMRFLCAEDCRGICPHCGTNRNHGECTCEDRSPDPRLQVLRSLRH